MKELIDLLIENARSGRPFAYCRLVETRGSTPQKAGAMMLVFPDGSQAGTLGGGCVEAEVKRRALAVIDKGKAEVAKFQLDNDYGWDDGLICGGRMQILIEPFCGNVQPEYFERIGQRVTNGEGGTEVIVFDAEANGLSVSSAYLLDEAGVPLATLRTEGDVVVGNAHPTKAAGKPLAALPDMITQNLKDLSHRPRAYAAQGISFLPMLPRCRLVIVGGGHVGKAVADMAVDLEFDVCVVDDRAEYVSAERFPRVQQRASGKIGDVLPSLEITPDTYCLIITRGHNHDEEALFHLANRGARYVGMIGSRRKIKMIFDDLLNEGVSHEALSQVYAPLGIDIGSQTVPEIAISICAELVSHRNRDGVVPGRPSAILEDAIS
jgi:xanthine dehydrogenase accessory factor